VKVTVFFHEGSAETVDDVSNLVVIDTRDLWLFKRPGSKPWRAYPPGDWKTIEVTDNTEV